MPIHLHAQPGEVAPGVVLVGDPGRATRAAALLEGAHQYNEYRGLLGYSGEFEGRRVSVQATGMGGPSAAIVLEELAQLGARTVVRAGTCGAIGPGVGVLDFVVASGAVPLDGTSRQYLQGEAFAPVADAALTHALAEEMRKTGRGVHVGLIMSQDAFYEQTSEWEKWRDRGVLAVEMEAAAIFTIALMRGLRAACVCLVVDQTAQPDTWVTEAGRVTEEEAMLRAAFRAVATQGD